MCNSSCIDSSLFALTRMSEVSDRASDMHPLDWLPEPALKTLLNPHSSSSATALARSSAEVRKPPGLLLFSQRKPPQPPQTRPVKESQETTLRDTMGILSFIYSVLGYNLCATLFIAYLLFDYVLGALATFGARYVMESKSGGAYVTGPRPRNVLRSTSHGIKATTPRRISTSAGSASTTAGRSSRSRSARSPSRTPRNLR